MLALTSPPRHDWRPDSLVRDLIPPINFNCRLSDGQLARVFPALGRWHAVTESGQELVWWTIDEACRWLDESGARPLGPA